MKVGILTFHRAHNYGAVLQVYALQLYLKKMGYEVEVIDYCPAYIRDVYKLFSREPYRGISFLTGIKVLLARCLKFPRRLLRYYRFWHFSGKHIPLSSQSSGKRSSRPIPAGYDLYVIGSDQVWDLLITQGFDPVFWGDFPIREGARRITYAASMERLELCRQESEHCRKLLQNFHAISVREVRLQELLQPLTGKKVEVMVDPTLLLTTGDYLKIAIQPKVKRPYLLVYQVGIYKETYRVAEKIAQENGWDILELVPECPLYTHRSVRDTAGPCEFLGLFSQAAFVVTTSFHGSIFATVFKKPFYTVSIPGNGNRIPDFLHSLELSDRLICSAQDVRQTGIDYRRVQEKKENWPEGTRKYFQNCFSLQVTGE